MTYIDGLRLLYSRKINPEEGESRSKPCSCSGDRARQLSAVIFFRYFFAVSAAIFSITIALDPPRAYTLPLAVTFSPAKGSSFSFWLEAGVLSAIGQ